MLPFSRVVLHNATLQNFFLRIGFKCSRKAGRQHPSKYDSRHKTPYSSTQEMHLGEKRAFSHTYIATTKYSDRQKWINKKVTTLHILKVDACCIYSIILHLLLLFSVCMFIFMLKLFMGEEKSVKRLSCSFCLFFSFAGMFFSIVKFTWS